jgi:hypothetical protein
VVDSLPVMLAAVGTARQVTLCRVPQVFRINVCLQQLGQILQRASIVTGEHAVRDALPAARVRICRAGAWCGPFLGAIPCTSGVWWSNDNDMQEAERQPPAECRRHFEGIRLQMNKMRSSLPCNETERSKWSNYNDNYLHCKQTINKGI